MRRLAVAVLFLALVVGSLSCGGGTFFISTNGHDVTFLSVSGTVTIVRLTITSDGQVTVVTLVNSGDAQTLNFCGNMVGQFPTNTFVTVNFTHNGGCENVSQVR